MVRGEQGTSQPLNRRYTRPMDKQTYSGAPVYEGADWTARRQAKLKCNSCKFHEFQTCDHDPVTCESFRELKPVRLEELAYRRVGSLADGGYGGSR